MGDMHLGKTSLVKHSIKVTDPIPFKERYRIPSSMSEEVRKYLKEMLEIGTIKKSNSPLASAVTLVRKKDGGLRFYKDLRRLNAKNSKDAYAFPRIDKTLGLLEWGRTLFNHRSEIQDIGRLNQMKSSKPLRAFTAGPLCFYECDWMPFGLTIAPATF